MYRQNFYVSCQSKIGDKDVQEDAFAVEHHSDIHHNQHFIYVGVFDGHGGKEASEFASRHMMEIIVKEPGFWSKDDEEVMKAISNGFIQTQSAMWKMRDKWPHTRGVCTPGTTASVGFIMNKKIYTAHVGDSIIILGYNKLNEEKWDAFLLSKEHRVEDPKETERIQKAGGKIIIKKTSSRHRVGIVGDKVRHSVNISRSLGNLWSYNEASGDFVVSPEPYCAITEIDERFFQCLIFATDGMTVPPEEALNIAQLVENARKLEEKGDKRKTVPFTVSNILVDISLKENKEKNIKSDNVTVVTVSLNRAEGNCHKRMRLA